MTNVYRLTVLGVSEGDVTISVECECGTLICEVSPIVLNAEPERLTGALVLHTALHDHERARIAGAISESVTALDALRTERVL